MDVVKKTSLIACTFVLSGCYTLKSAYNQMSILASRESYESALAKPNLTLEQKNKLLLAQEVRDFAIRDLKLHSNGNYNKVTWLDRPYVTWTVSASDVWQIKPYEWSFPIVGKVPYLGFFTQKEAEAEEKDMKDKGYDTYVRGVSAYSTLGWFADPLLSSMLNYSEHTLAETLVHELVHTTVWIKDSVDFNERLASFLGQKGAELFYLKKEGTDSPTYKRIQDEMHDDRVFSDFITAQIKELDVWYKDLKPEDKILEKKNERIKQIQELFAKNVIPLLRTNNWKKFSELQLNNARLMMYRTYMQDFSSFERLWAKLDGNFPLFIENCKKLIKEKNPDQALLKLTESL